MAVTGAHLNQHLNDVPDSETGILTDLVKAASAHISKLVGFPVNTAEDERPDLDQAILMLAAHWYENREGTVVGVTAQEIPFGVQEIVRENRNYTFG